MAHPENVINGRTAPLAIGEYDLVEVAHAMRSLSERVADNPGRPLDRLVAVAVERVPGA